MGSLARRGVEMVHTAVKDEDTEKLIREISPWSVALIVVTAGLFMLITSSMEYTIRLVFGHLAMVEHPDTTVEVEIYEPVSKEDLKVTQNLVDAGLIEASDISEPTFVAKTKPITSSIRRTKRHITNIAGKKAQWRGLGIFILYTILYNFARGLLRMPLRVIPFGCVLADVGAGILAARLHCAWTHKVISMPSSKTLRERMVSRVQWRELMVPTAISVGAHSSSRLAIRHMYLFSVQGAAMLDAQKAPKWIIAAVAVLPTLIGAAVLGIFVMFPAYVALVRKEASLLDPEEETIVAMDRTFGGRLSHIGDKLNFAEAWNSFSWEARVRVVKLYAKLVAVMAVPMFVGGFIIAIEMMVAAGPNAEKIIKGIQDHINHTSL